MTSMELWLSEERAVRSEGIGPSREERSLGKVRGPGLYNFVAENADGKSSHLRALLQLQKEKLLATEVNVNDGAVRGTLELEPAKLTVERGPTGLIRNLERSGDGDVPSITEIPSEIEVLISGAGVKSPDARARRRIQALLSYVPVDANEARVEQLLEVLLEKPFASVPVEQRRAIEGLVAAGNRSQQRATAAQEILDGGEMAQKLRGLLSTDRSILEVQEDLVKLANALGNVCEKAVAAQQREVSNRQGKVEQIVESYEGDGDLREIAFDFVRIANLEGDECVSIEDQRAALAGEIDQVRNRFRELSEARAVRVNLESKVAELRQSHGERPTLDPNLIDEHGKLREIFEHEFSLDGATAEEIEASRRSVADAQKIMVSLEVGLRAYRDKVSLWDSNAKQLSAAIEGPEQDEVDKLEADGRYLAERLATFDLARTYIAASEEHDEAINKLGRYDELAKAYRGVAKDSWSYLGAIITDAVELPWLQVDGLDIFIGFVKGKLNDDPEIVAEARRIAEQAARLEETDHDVALPRFVFEKIREVSQIDWRSVDDDERISTAELHDAFMSVMIERREKLGGGIVVLPWTLVGALSERSMIRLHDKLAAANLVAFSERPRRRGDRDGLFLEYVGELNLAADDEEE